MGDGLGGNVLDNTKSKEKEEDDGEDWMFRTFSRIGKKPKA